MSFESDNLTLLLALFRLTSSQNFMSFECANLTGFKALDRLNHKNLQKLMSFECDKLTEKVLD